LEYILQNSDRKLKIVTNWCTTKSLDDIAKKYDAEVFKTTVGESSIIDKMNEISADIAGDGSGSVAFANHIMSFDNLMVMGVILEAMAKQRCTSAELASSIPRYNIIKKKVSCPSSHAYNAIKGFKNIYNQPDRVFVEESDIRKIRVIKNSFDIQKNIILLYISLLLEK